MSKSDSLPTQSVSDTLDRVDRTQPETQTEGQEGSRWTPGRVLALMAAGVFVGILVVATVWHQGARPTDGRAPEFQLTLFDGSQISLQELRGQPVILNFWASWCGPCRYEAPALENVYQQYKDHGLVVLGVAYLDQEPASRRFIEEFSLSYPNGPDLGSKIGRQYRLQGVPETFFIDREGNIVSYFIGPVHEELLHRRVAQILE